MATPSFDKVFIVRKRKDRERLLRIMSKSSPALETASQREELPDFEKAEEELLRCLLHSSG